MASSATVWPFEGTKIAVLADCHIHPGGGPAFPPALFEHLDVVDPDLIVTLGDMGEAAGLDELSAFAPVIGVRGQDDCDDPRTDNALLVLKTERYAIGCVFDAEAAGLVHSNDPLAPAADADALSKRLFGVDVDVLLYASTHRPGEGRFGKGSAFNPGSAVLPAEGSERAFLLLTISDEGPHAEFVRLS